MNRICRNVLINNGAPQHPHRDPDELMEALLDEVRALRKELKLLRKQKAQQQHSHLDNYVLGFGKFAGFPLKDCPRHYLKWFARQDPLSQTTTYEDYLVVKKYLAATEDEG